MENDPDHIPEWCRGEDWCPVTATASLISRKWKPAIIDRLLKHESLGFSELQDSIDGISGKALSNNLQEMEAAGLVDRTTVDVRPFRVKYSLTDRGEEFEPIIDAMAEWANHHLESSPGEGSTTGDE